MQLKLWKQVNLSMLIPVLIATAIILYAVHNLGTISKRIKFIEIADDINLTLLELRRYEKNLLLFHEDKNIEMFNSYLKQIDKAIRAAENEIIEKSSMSNFRILQDNMRIYRDTAKSLAAVIKTDQKLLDDIRPIGRSIEKNAYRKEMALELRRWEKNYIIYREQKALDKVKQIANDLASVQPQLDSPILSYLSVFDSFVKNEILKNELIEQMRSSGRSMQTLTMEFSERKRAAIDGTISTSRKLLLASLIFLIVSTSVVARLFSSSIVAALSILGSTFERLKSGDFTRGIELETESAPAEITSFVTAYNQTVEALGASKVELEETLIKLQETNRELVEKQDALVEARKFTAMRLLASEIAHEINNPLSSLAIFLGICHEEMPTDDPKRETIELMRKEVNRCISVLAELVEFARKEPMKVREANPSALLRDAIKVVCRQHEKSGVNLTAFFSELPEKIQLDPVLIHQALVNILNNAYQFTDPGGSIEIEGFMDCNSMVIEIKDSGSGISEENLPYIFEPFFSTRKELGGAGLGLAITRKIIERHYGTIHVASSANKETVFTIRLAINKTYD
jgi:two-component system NtrC family sensor kinase